MVDRQRLIDDVIQQIQEDVENGDHIAIEGMLEKVPTEVLQGYLPEEGLQDEV